MKFLENIIVHLLEIEDCKGIDHIPFIMKVLRRVLHLFTLSIAFSVTYIWNEMQCDIFWDISYMLPMNVKLVVWTS